MRCDFSRNLIHGAPGHRKHHNVLRGRRGDRVGCRDAKPRGQFEDVRTPVGEVDVEMVAQMWNAEGAERTGADQAERLLRHASALMVGCLVLRSVSLQHGDASRFAAAGGSSRNNNAARRRHLFRTNMIDLAPRLWKQRVIGLEAVADRDHAGGIDQARTGVKRHRPHRTAPCDVDFAPVVAAPQSLGTAFPDTTIQDQ